jgi:hypothetical protein
MKMTPVKSSHVTHIGHHGETLHVTYKGGSTYRLHPVTEEQYQILMDSDSKGAALRAMGVRGTKI